MVLKKVAVVQKEVVGQVDVVVVLVLHHELELNLIGGLIVVV